MTRSGNGKHPSPPDSPDFLSLPDSRPGILALLSGGLDSAIMVGLAAERDCHIVPLYLRQGFVWEDEEEAAVRRYLSKLRQQLPGGIDSLRVGHLSNPEEPTTAWARDAEHPAPDVVSPDEAVYLPGRNLALLTQAAFAAYTGGLTRIQLGALSSNPFPDATPAFFRAFERSVEKAMCWPIHVETPLGHLTKTETLELGYHFPLEETVSCIRPVGGRHCGACNKCEERRVAFRRAGLPDRTHYQ